MDILRQGAPSPVVPPTQPVFNNQNTDIHSLLATAHEKYTLHENREAIAYCNRALKLDPENPDAWCIKGISEDASHNTAAAITAFATFLKLPAAKTPQYASWQSYAATRLRALRGW
jgi:Flp pilus assembly protein TadD